MMDDEEYKEKFPEEFYCLYCEDRESIPRDLILEHFKSLHDQEEDSTWKRLYVRLSMIGLI